MEFHGQCKLTIKKIATPRTKKYNNEVKPCDNKSDQYLLLLLFLSLMLGMIAVKIYMQRRPILDGKHVNKVLKTN